MKKIIIPKVSKEKLKTLNEGIFDDESVRYFTYFLKLLLAGLFGVALIASII